MREYKLEVYPAFEKSMDIGKVFTFGTEPELHAASDAVADMLLYIQDEGLMADYSNLFCKYQLVDGEWEEMDE
jgi:hypothetical protein